MENNLLKEIDKNINKIKSISKIAQKEKIDFKTAKIMFNDGNNDIEISTAQKIKEIADKYKMPSNIVQRVILDNNDSDIEEWHIYYEIYKTNDIINQNEEIKKIGTSYSYIKKIHELIKYGISIEDADKIIQIKINAYSKLHKVSKLVATLKVAYDFEKDGAKKYAEIIDFFEKENRILSDYMELNLREYLYSSNTFKKKKINGITIVSKTEDGLQKLENIVNESMEKGNEEYRKLLEKASEKEALLITDYSYSTISCHYTSLGMIYLQTDERNISNLTDVFFHETSHFLDNTNRFDGDDYYSEAEPKIREIFEKIRTEINNTPIELIIKNQKIPLSIRKLIQDVSSKTNMGIYAKGIKYFMLSSNRNANEFICDARLNQKWKDEIEKKYSFYSRDDRNLFYRQKLNYEKQKYITLISAVYDIYDGLSKGNLHSYLGKAGHGKKYYSIKNNDIIEFIANIGAIYNSGGKDILEFEFGPELANEIIQIYKETIKNKRANLDESNMKIEFQGIKEDSDTKNAIVTQDESIKDLESNKEQQIRKKISILKNIKKYIENLSTTNEKKR